LQPAMPASMGQGQTLEWLRTIGTSIAGIHAFFSDGRLTIQVLALPARNMVNG